MDTESSKASGVSVIREATSANLRCPSCRGRKDPGNTTPGQGSLTSVRPSGYTVTVRTPEPDSGSVNASVGLVCLQRAIARRSPSVSSVGTSNTILLGIC